MLRMMEIIKAPLLSDAVDEQKISLFTLSRWKGIGEEYSIFASKVWG
jgi:hypothetical protein